MRLIPLGLALLAAVAGCAALEDSPSVGVTVGELVNNPGAFDGKFVTVAGQVGDVALHGGGRGARLGRIFDLADGSQAIRVVSTVGPTCRKGSTATVNGRFSKRNGVLEATWVSC